LPLPYPVFSSLHAEDYQPSFDGNFSHIFSDFVYICYIYNDLSENIPTLVVAVVELDNLGIRRFMNQYLEQDRMRMISLRVKFLQNRYRNRITKSKNIKLQFIGT